MNFNLKLPEKNTYKYPDFARLILKLSPPEFFGICKILNINIYKDEKDEQERPIARDALEIINDVLLSFEKLNRTQRRNLMKVARTAAK